MSFATISASGTWSTLDQFDPTPRGPFTRTAGLPTQENLTVEEDYNTNSLNYTSDGGLGTAANGVPEVTQFIGLYAQGYGIPAGAAIDRILATLNSMRQTQEPSAIRVYP